MKEEIRLANEGNTAIEAVLRKIEVASVLESSVNMKAIDALPARSMQGDGKIDGIVVGTEAKQSSSVAVNQSKATIDIVAETSHSEQHGANAEKFEQQIKEGVIGRNTLILLERKAYGNNLSMQDVIKLANIMQHNEKNEGTASLQIKIPDKIKENPMILADAQIYKVAPDHGVRVIGLEGGNLSAQRDSPEYNINREQYMAAVITEVQSKGYNVIVNIGSTHKERLEERLTALQDKGSVGLNHMPRQLAPDLVVNELWLKTSRPEVISPKEQNAELELAATVSKEELSKVGSKGLSFADKILQKTNNTESLEASKALKKDKQKRDSKSPEPKNIRSQLLEQVMPIYEAIKQYMPSNEKVTSLKKSAEKTQGAERTTRRLPPASDSKSKGLSSRSEPISSDNKQIPNLLKWATLRIGATATKLANADLENRSANILSNKTQTHNKNTDSSKTR